MTVKDAMETMDDFMARARDEKARTAWRLLKIEVLAAGLDEERTPAPTSREDFVKLFQGPLAATEFENQVLSIGNAFLPPCARTVRDGGEATPQYWEWLISQTEG